MGNFAENFVSAIPAGVAWGQAAAQGYDRKQFMKAGEVLGEAEKFDPWGMGGQQTAIPGPDGKPVNPEGGQVNPDGSVTGFSGDTWQNYKSRYMQAISKIGDPQKYALAMDRFAQVEKTKVLGYLDSAIASAQAGNSSEASRQLAAVSAFMNPGVTPRVTYDQKSGAYMVQNPGGGYAATVENLMDMKHQIVNFEGYRKFALDRSKFRAAAAAAAASRAESRRRWDISNAREEKKFNLEVRKKELDIAKTELELDTAVKTQEAGIATAYADAQSKQAAADKATAEAAVQVEGASQALDEAQPGGSNDPAMKKFKELTSTKQMVDGPKTTEEVDGMTTTKSTQQEAMVRDPIYSQHPIIDHMAANILKGFEPSDGNYDAPTTEEKADIVYDMVGEHADGYKQSYRLRQDETGQYWVSSDINDFRISETAAQQYQKYVAARARAAGITAADPNGTITSNDTTSAIDAATPQEAPATQPAPKVDDTSIQPGAMPVAPTPGEAPRGAIPDQGPITNAPSPVQQPPAKQAPPANLRGANLQTTLDQAVNAGKQLNVSGVKDWFVRQKLQRAVAQGDKAMVQELIGMLSTKEKQALLGY